MAEDLIDVAAERARLRARVAELEANYKTLVDEYANGVSGAVAAALDRAAGLADEMYERGEEHLIAAAILKMKENQ